MKRIWPTLLALSLSGMLALTASGQARNLRSLGSAKQGGPPLICTDYIRIGGVHCTPCETFYLRDYPNKRKSITEFCRSLPPDSCFNYFYTKLRVTCDSDTPAPTPKPKPAPSRPQPGGSGWTATAAAQRGKNGQRFSFTCPPRGSPVNVWGTDTYTDDSSVCTAAVHAGLVTLASGGTVTIETRPGASSYTGSSRHGITSESYGSWKGSYVFVTGG